MSHTLTIRVVSLQQLGCCEVGMRKGRATKAASPEILFFMAEPFHEECKRECKEDARSIRGASHEHISALE
jgi:hypothetical protein